MHRRNIARHAKTQSLFLQMSLLKVDSAYAWYILNMLTAVLCYGEVGGKSPLQLSSQTHFVKIEDKKAIAKNLI